MILTDLKNYLASVQSVSLNDLAIRFNSDAQAIRAMLELLIRKGNIRRTKKTTACGSLCNKCDLHTTEIYEWINKK